MAPPLPAFLTLLALFTSTSHATNGFSSTGADKLERIDVHSHFVPPFWRNISTEAGFGEPDGMPKIPSWTEQAHLEFMEQANITKSILSITSPGTHLIPGDDALARHVSRECNEYAADLKSRHPDKFGFWAALPLPDVEGSLVEIAYAFDQLNADGVSMFTNTHGVYLGDKRLEPVFDELNRRNATVFIHPTSPCVDDGQKQHSGAPLTQYPNPIFEFFFDSARAVINLFLSETVSRFVGITYIVSHAGGALPPIIERFTKFASSIIDPPVQISSDMVKEAFARQFYFDMAGFVFPDQIYGLLRYVNAGRILYGSDYPYTPASGALEIGETINEHIGMAFPDPYDHLAIFSGNAQQILEKSDS